MKEKYLLLIMCISVLMIGCEKNSLTEKSETKDSNVQIEAEHNNIEIVNLNKENYKTYTGNWRE